MRKKKRYIAIIIIILLLGIGILIIYGQSSMAKDKKSLTFYLPRSTSYASNWNYELSDSGILKEVESRRYRSVSKYYDYWMFEPINSGEVTIYFIAQYQTEEVKEDSFSITYYVNEDYQITEITSNNKLEKINFDDDTLGLLMLKFSDFCFIHISNLFVIIVDLFYFLVSIFK
ncbi:MAG: protease inhibitor I42 family protein [Lachnospiraceae bacterium]|nr:protease inhibitor I42 family protein [Lachnospiraceae bacterium]